ncbi:MAG: tetratricopeptide repeat protein [Deltaproteobacteria bacterium]|nr:tetratricopeptide repeat protein [Deltaproteobacteria bacterium]
MRGRVFFIIATAAVFFVSPFAANGEGLDSVKWLEKGQELARAGKIEEAVAAFDLAIEKDARVPELYYNRGLAYEGLENHKMAIDDFSKAIELNPNYVEAYFERGNAYFGITSLWQAVRDYTKALDIDPGLAKAYYTRGYAYLLLKDKEDGMADIKKAAKMGHEPARIFLKANGTEAK